MGADQWRNLTTWVQWQRFPELTNLAVFKRNRIAFSIRIRLNTRVLPASDSKTAQRSGIFLLNLPEQDVSSLRFDKFCFKNLLEAHLLLVSIQTSITIFWNINFTFPEKALIRHNVFCLQKLKGRSKAADSSQSDGLRK